MYLVQQSRIHALRKTEDGSKQLNIHTHNAGVDKRDDMLALITANSLLYSSIINSFIISPSAEYLPTHSRGVQPCNSLYFTS